MNLETLRERRSALGLSQARLARLTGFAPLSISMWERLITTPSTKNQERLDATLQKLEVLPRVEKKPKPKPEPKSRRNPKYKNLSMTSLMTLAREIEVELEELNAEFETRPDSLLLPIAITKCTELLSTIRREMRICEQEKTV